MTTEEAVCLIKGTISGNDIPVEQQNKSWLLILFDPDKGHHYYDVTSTAYNRKCPLVAFKRITELHPDYVLAQVQGFKDRRGSSMAARLLKSHDDKLRAKLEVDIKVAAILAKIDKDNHS